MKLKEQMNKQRAYAIHKQTEAKEANNTALFYYWYGIIQSMDWVQESRDKWTYMDGSPMPEDKGSAF